MDDWLAIDKLEHFVACACVVFLLHLALTRLHLWEGFRLMFAGSVAAVAAGGKEFGDHMGVSRHSRQELLAFVSVP